MSSNGGFYGQNARRIQRADTTELIHAIGRRAVESDDENITISAVSRH